jgi:ribose 1,5-bisphosphokinase
MTDLHPQQSIGPGRLVLVVGPSGGGKDTIIAGAKEAIAGNPAVVFPRRVVTRPASAAEDHASLDDAAFDQAVRDGGFAFWWQAHGLKYGIAQSIDDDVRAGRTIVCNVSRTAIDELRARYADVRVILVTAPADILAARLAGRARGTDGPIEQRLKRNEAFTGFRADVVVNNAGAPDDAVRALLDVIQP